LVRTQKGNISREKKQDMKNPKIVIVGGVAGGATAAARLRRLNEKSAIVLIERGELKEPTSE
jgi:choline dehydrogenase-like flavoprotein